MRLHMLLTLCILTWCRSTWAVTSLLPAACPRPSIMVKSVSRRTCEYLKDFMLHLDEEPELVTQGCEVTQWQFSPAPCAGTSGSWKDKQAWQNNPIKFFMETNLAYLVKENSCYSFLMRLMLWEISQKCLFLILNIVLSKDVIAQNGTRSVCLLMLPWLSPIFGSVL